MGNSSSQSDNNRNDNPSATNQNNILLLPQQQLLTNKPLFIEYPNSIFLLDCSGQQHEFSKEEFSEFAKSLNVELYAGGENDFVNNCNRLRKAILNYQIQQHELERQNQSQLAIDQFKVKTCPTLLHDYSQREWANFYQTNKNHPSLANLDPDLMSQLISNSNNDPWYLEKFCDAVRSNLVRRGEVPPDPVELSILRNLETRTNRYRAIQAKAAQDIALIRQNAKTQLAQIA